jgi:hypothetical protein
VGQRGGGSVGQRISRAAGQWGSGSLWKWARVEVGQGGSGRAGKVKAGYVSEEVGGPV